MPRPSSGLDSSAAAVNRYLAGAGTPREHHREQERAAVVPERPRGIKLHKSEQSIRIGVSFEREDLYTGEGALVRAIHPYGLATQAGLSVGDVVLTINGKRVSSPLIAAEILRDSVGDLWLSVQRAPERADDALDIVDDLHASRDMGPSTGTMRPTMRQGHASPSRESPSRVPALSVGKAAAWQARSMSSPSGGASASAAGGDAAEDFDLGQLTQRALNGLTTLLTGRHPAESSARGGGRGGGEPDWLGDISHSLGRLLQPREHEAATKIAAAYRAYRAREALRAQQEAALEVQMHARALSARRHAASARGAFLAAVTIQKWVRGLIDRQWVSMVKEEVDLLRIAAEEAEAQLRYSSKTNRRDKVKRAFSFKRKKQRSQRQHIPTAQELLTQGGHLPASPRVSTPPPPATPGGTLSSLKRSLSFGRRSKSEKENKEEFVDMLGVGEELPQRAEVLEARPAQEGIKRSFSWSRKQGRDEP